MKELVTAAEVARVLGCSRSEVYALASRGTIPHYRFARSIRFNLLEVLAAVHRPAREERPPERGWGAVR